MTPDHSNPPTPRAGAPARLTPPAAGQPRAAKRRPQNLTHVKLLLGAASLAATIGGWGLLAQQDAALAEQTAAQPDLVALVAEATPTATALAAADTPTSPAAIAPATATTETAAATPEPAPPTATTETVAATAEPTATATTPPTATATTRTTITRSRSSR
jgi:hypothetical protein